MASEVLSLVIGDGVSTSSASAITLLQTQVVEIAFTGSTYDLDVSSLYGWDAKKSTVIATWRETGDYENEELGCVRPSGSATTLRLTKADSTSVTYKALIVGSP